MHALAPTAYDLVRVCSLSRLIDKDRSVAEAHLEACHAKPCSPPLHEQQQSEASSSSTSSEAAGTSQPPEAIAIQVLETRLPHVLAASAWPANATVWSINISHASEERESLLAAFLGAREWDVARAEAFLIDTLTWRREHRIGTDVEESAMEASVDAHVNDEASGSSLFPHDAIQVVRDPAGGGKRLYVVVRLGRIRREELSRVDDFVAWRVREQERVCLALGAASEWEQAAAVRSGARGHALGPKYTLVLDTAGMRPYHVGADSRAALAKLTHVFTHYYPDFVGQTVVVNAPWFVTATWAAVSLLMPSWWGVQLGRMSELEALPGWL